jgi:hypothetical protein
VIGKVETRVDGHAKELELVNHFDFFAIDLDELRSIETLRRDEHCICLGPVDMQIIMITPLEKRPHSNLAFLKDIVTGEG